jgi:hypothetical protein
MTDNLKTWNDLARTDPTYTKGFKRAGGFQGTDINPVWRWKRMTEVYGPAGIGWGTQDENVTYQPAGDGQVLVYVTLKLWYMDPETSDKCVTPLGVGGDFVAKTTKYGLGCDDEAVKKATTDAIGNAMKFLGMGADIFLGQFDDSKYQQEVKSEYAAKERQQAEEQQKAKQREQLEQAAPPPAEGEQNIDPATRVANRILDLLRRADTEAALSDVRDKHIKPHWRALDKQLQDQISEAVGDARERLGLPRKPSKAA